MTMVESLVARNAWPCSQTTLKQRSALARPDTKFAERLVTLEPLGTIAHQLNNFRLPNKLGPGPIPSPIYTMNIHKFSITENQWTLLMCILISEMESYTNSSCSEQRKTGRRLGTVITKLRKYKFDTNQ